MNLNYSCTDYWEFVSSIQNCSHSNITEMNLIYLFFSSTVHPFLNVFDSWISPNSFLLLSVSSGATRLNFILACGKCDLRFSFLVVDRTWYMQLKRYRGDEWFWASWWWRDRIRMEMHYGPRAANSNNVEGSHEGDLRDGYLADRLQRFVSVRSSLSKSCVGWGGKVW